MHIAYTSNIGAHLTDSQTKQKRPKMFADALPEDTKKSICYSLTANCKSRDASASKSNQSAPAEFFSPQFMDL